MHQVRGWFRCVKVAKEAEAGFGLGMHQGAVWAFRAMRIKALPRGTAQNILRRLKEILQVPLKLVAGDITEVRERAALP